MKFLDPAFLAVLGILAELVEGRSSALGYENCLQPLISGYQQICPAPSSWRTKAAAPRNVTTGRSHKIDNQKPIINTVVDDGDDLDLEGDDLDLESDDDENDEYALPPSWHGPENCIGDFCMYWNTEVGDGLAMFSTARNAWLAATFQLPPDTKVVEPTAFYEKLIPGKGMGLIANRTIRRGEIIMERTPTLLLQATPHVDLDPKLRAKIYESAVDKLPEPTRQKYMRQYGDTVSDKIDKNSFQMVLDGKAEYSKHLAVFPDVSRMNHDCRPNIHYRLTTLTHTSVAVRDIQPGEELTVSYIYGPTSFSDRQSQLLTSWGFKCTCSQCSLPKLESLASDARIKQIKELEEEIERKMAENGGRDMKPEMAGRLVKLYLDERLEAYVAPTYVKAALIYSMFGDEEKALEYAREAVDALAREYGKEGGDVRSMRDMLADLKGHWSWRIKVARPPPGGSPGDGRMDRDAEKKKKEEEKKREGNEKRKPVSGGGGVRKAPGGR